MEATGGMTQEREHIRLLATFHWVVAAFSGLFSLFPLLHLLMGIGMVTGRFSDAKGQAAAQLFGWFFIIFAGLWIVCGLAFSICLALAGHYLSQFRHHTHCLVRAGLACMFIPFGTVLGVFTIIVLTKEPVRALFPGSHPPGSPA